MKKEDIYIKRAIVHILDTKSGTPVLSTRPLEFGSEFVEFLKSHIAKVAEGDESKECHFYKNESEIYQMLQHYSDKDFAEVSRQIANLLYRIMESNIDIPPADLAVVRFNYRDNEYMALLKLNYKEFYIHRTMPVDDEEEEDEQEFVNEIIRHKSVLPSGRQKLSEAAVINLNDLSLWAVEKKYEVNGEKTNYFTYLFLKCSSRIPVKSKLSIIAKVIKSVQDDAYDELSQFEHRMKARSILKEMMEESGRVKVEAVMDEVFGSDYGAKARFQEKMEKYDMSKDEILIQEEKTLNMYHNQYLTTDTGIEVKIPMDQYKNPEGVEFITNSDGTTSLMIKNIGYLQARL